MARGPGSSGRALLPRLLEWPGRRRDASAASASARRLRRDPRPGPHGPSGVGARGIQLRRGRLGAAVGALGFWQCRGTPLRPAAGGWWGKPLPTNLRLHPVEDGRRRVVGENVRPEVDAGRSPAKGSLGEPVVVEADIFGDGHDQLTAVLLWRPVGHREEASWREVPMAHLVNDRWQGSFEPRRTGTYEFAVQAWVDHFKSWEHDLERRDRADAAAELEEGAKLVDEAGRRAPAADAARLGRFGDALRGANGLRTARSPALLKLMEKHGDRSQAACSPRTPRVLVERERARFSAWYEVFPRSTSPDPGRAGTFQDLETRLPYVAGMGFHILYLPPIHPIGRAFRKGRNNTVSGTRNDVGSP